MMRDATVGPALMPPESCVDALRDGRLYFAAYGRGVTGGTEKTRL